MRSSLARDANASRNRRRETSGSTKPMQDLKKIERQLRDRLASLNERVEKIDDDLAAPSDDDFAEMASESAGDEVLESVGRAAEDEIRQINLALERIEQGVYGVCVECGVSIPQARLEAVPYTTRCIRCAEC